MSDTIERTLASITSVVKGEAQLGGGKSPGFISFLTLFSKIRSKSEEEHFVEKEILLQKQRLSQPGVSLGNIRETLVRLLYCHMLGYNVDFAHIHAVKLAQQGTLLDKRVGYLVCSIFLKDNDEFLMLVVNTIQKDLQSTNILDVCVALTVLNYLVTTEIIPTLLPAVEQKLSHPREIIRKKAVLCLYHFHQKAPELVQHVHRHFRQALCDRDPSVMWAALHVFTDIARNGGSLDDEIIHSLIAVLKQITDRKLPSGYDYNGVPAPWLQIQLLRTLAMLPSIKKHHTDVLHPVLADILQRTEASHKIGLAVIYECLETISSIQPNSALFEHAAKCVGRFVTAKSNNLRYLGLKALISLVEVSSHYAVDHQRAVINCLEDSDQTIQIKTLELLQKICNKENVDVICAKIVEHMKATTDKSVQQMLGLRVAQLAQQYSNNVMWYVGQLGEVLALLGTKVTPTMVTSVLSYLKANTESNTQESCWLVAHFMQWLQLDNKPDPLIQIAVWTLGEYAKNNQAVQPRQVMNLLLSVFTASEHEGVQSAVLTALVKLSAHIQHPDTVIGILQSNIVKDNYLLDQQLHELRTLLKNESVKELLQQNDQRDNLEMDFFLSFLDKYVCEALDNGGVPYKHKSLRILPQESNQGNESLFANLPFTAYKSDSIPTGGSSGSAYSTDRALSLNTIPSDGDKEDNRESGSIDKKKLIPQIWSKGGLIKDAETTKDSPPVKNLPPSSPGEELDLSGEMETSRKNELASALFGSISQSGQMEESKFDKKTKGQEILKPNINLTTDNLSASDPGVSINRQNDSIKFSSLPAEIAHQVYDTNRLDSLEDDIDDFVTVERTLESEAVDHNSAIVYDHKVPRYDFRLNNSAVPNDLLELPHKDRANMLLDSDLYKVYFTKFYKATSVVVAVFVQMDNCVGSCGKLTLQDDSKQVLLENYLDKSQGESSHRLEINSKCVKDDQMSFFIEITCLELIHEQWTLTGNLELLENSTLQSQSILIPLDVTSFSRPYEINIEEYAQKWQSCHSKECKCSLKINNDVRKEFLDELEKTAKIIQCKNNEVILASELNCQHYCLIHYSASEEVAQIWIKSNHNSLPQLLSKFFTQHYG